MTELLKHPIPGPIERRKQDNTGVSGRNDRWYVVQTRPNREAEAKRQLENQQFRAFLPLYSKTVSHARKLQKIRAPLFPGYMFVVLDLDRDHWHKVNGTIGVTSLIMAGERPSPVKAGVVETLIESTAKDGALCFMPPLRIGERMRLAAGPFAEQLGILQQFGASQRVHVLLEIMGGKIPVSLPRDDVLPVETYPNWWSRPNTWFPPANDAKRRESGPKPKVRFGTKNGPRREGRCATNRKLPCALRYLPEGQIAKVCRQGQS